MPRRFGRVPAGHFIGINKIMADKLDAGDVFPSLAIDLVGGGTMNVPEDMDAKYKIIMFYRGHW